jgi:type IV fimbrial biogenesis protein FimT
MLELKRPRRPARASRGRGFTLVELMVTLSIVAILMLLSAPSFTSFLRNSELSSAANTFVASLNAARSEAMKRNLPAMVVPLDAARSDWTQGFVAFVDVDRDGAYSEKVDITVLRQPLTASYLSIEGTGSAKAAPAYVRYDGSGFAKKADDSPNNLSISISRNDVPGTESYAQSRRIFIARTGRLRICVPASTADKRCPLLDPDA